MSHKLLVSFALLLLSASNLFGLTREEAMDAILSLPEVGDVSSMQISMPYETHGSTVVAVDINEELPDSPMPYVSTWFAMIDRAPFAGWGHPAFWVYLNDDNPTEYTIEVRETIARLIDQVTMSDVLIECMEDPLNYPELLSCSWPMFQGKGSGLQIPGDVLPGGEGCVYACIFGANSYGGWGNIVNADAAHFKNALTGAGVPANQVTLDTDGTSETEIKTCVETQCANITPRDNLVLYIGTHGFVDKLDLRTNSSDALSDENELTSAELKTIVEACSTACRVFIFIEACHSGSFIPVLDDIPNAIIVTACKSEELAYEGDSGEGAWGKCFSANIPGTSANTAHGNCDNEVQTKLETEWAAWCAANPADCKQTPQYGANPSVRRENDPIATCCVGACCFDELVCGEMLEHECAKEGGIWLGDGSSCTPNPCPTTSIERTSWGKLKGIFR